VLAPAQVGGLERVVTMLASGQKADGVHVAALLTPGEAANHPFITRLEALAIPVTPLEVGARSYLREYRSLGALIDRLGPSVIHTHGYRADVIAGQAARARGVPIVSTVHGFTGGGIRNRVYERVQCFALSRADAVIAVSRPLVHRLVRAGISPRRIRCVPNAFLPPEAILGRAVARRELGLHDDSNVVAWVGRLSPEKGADVMLDAIAECDSTWQLSIIGDGPERNRLHEQAEQLGIDNRVTWHGAIVNAGSVLTAFDAFVLSSRTEGTPIALFEAMYAGVPVVATRVGGVPDVVASTHALLVPSENPRMIARALEEIAREPSAAMKRSALARQKVLHSFSAAPWLAAIDAVYNEVRAKRGKSGIRRAQVAE